MKPSSKNVLALVVSSLLIFGISGCDKKSGDAPEAPAAAPSEAPAAPAPAPAEEAPPAAE